MARAPMSLFGSLLMLAVVVGGAAATLKGVDLLARAFSDDGGERRWASVAELERGLGYRLALPAYFPQSLAWPPGEVRTVGHGPRTALLGFTAVDGGPLRLVVAQTLGAPGELPAEALPEGAVLERRELSLAGRPARLTRFLGEDGFTWHDLAWEQGGQTLLLRSRGGVEQLVKMAESVRREGP